MNTTNIFNAAIEAHAQWKVDLKKNVEEGSFQDIKTIVNSHACDLGSWIYGEGYRYNRLPSFESMCSAHERFHRVAAEVVCYSNTGEKEKAKKLLSPDGSFSQTSAKLVKAIMDCSRELSIHLEKGMYGACKVADLLKTKKDEKVYTIDNTSSVWDAINMMVNHNIGSLAVYNKRELTGFFTERGLVKNLVHKGAKTLESAVSEMVDAETVYVHPEDTIKQCLILMTSAHTRHLPVMCEGKLMGIISIGDVIKKVSSDEENMISMLEGYIHGDYGMKV